MFQTARNLASGAVLIAAFGTAMYGWYWMAKETAAVVNDWLDED